MHRNVRCRLRLHPRFADPEASILIEFMIKFVRKLVDEPPMTADLSSYSAFVTDADDCLCIFFLFWGWKRRDVEGEGKSCKLPLSISHVPVLTGLPSPFST